MYKILKEKYKKLEELSNKKNIYNKKEKIKKQKLSIYSTILGYYASKEDTNHSYMEEQNHDMLKKYDKKLMHELGVQDSIDSFVEGEFELNIENFDNSIDFISLTNSNLNDSLDLIKNDFYNSYRYTTTVEKERKSLLYQIYDSSKKEEKQIYKLLK